jgi:hypothetical protein
VIHPPALERGAECLLDGCGKLARVNQHGDR